MDLKNIWFFNYFFFFDYNLNDFVNFGVFGLFLFFWGFLFIVVVVLVIIYFFGKCWYCLWVCGCGGLVEILGDFYC